MVLLVALSTDCITPQAHEIHSISCESKPACSSVGKRLVRLNAPARKVLWGVRKGLRGKVYQKFLNLTQGHQDLLFEWFVSCDETERSPTASPSSCQSITVWGEENREWIEFLPAGKWSSSISGAAEPGSLSVSPSDLVGAMMSVWCLRLHCLPEDRQT